jgi:SAM-dependent methyltransferase
MMPDHHSDVVERRLAHLVTTLPGRDVVDVGGGTGTRAVPLALLGCHVTVVDSSTDALASLARRAADAGVADRIDAIQADADQTSAVLAAGIADLVLLHGVLDDVDVPGSALVAAARLLRPGGRISVLVAGRFAALIALAFAGRFARADSLVERSTAGPGVLADTSTGAVDSPSQGGLYDVASLTALLQRSGLRAESVVGVGVLAGLAGAAGRRLPDDPDGATQLADLEEALGTDPVGRELATYLHAIASLLPSP